MTMGAGNADDNIRVPLTFAGRLVRILCGAFWLLLALLILFLSFLMLCALVAGDWRPELTRFRVLVFYHDWAKLAS